MSLKEKVYAAMPIGIQNLMITAFNLIEYKKRYGGKYSHYMKVFRSNRTWTREELYKYQSDRFSLFVEKAMAKSSFYAKLFDEIDNPEKLENLSKLPILTKEILRNNTSDIFTIDKSLGIVSKTGGTTGKSLEILFTPENMQERFAMLDDFRSRFGYELGKKVAWFSGKSLLRDRDIRKGLFWRTDYLHKVRYYSTFHIKDSYLKYYVENLIKFRPEYIVGFPSSIAEVAKYGIKNGYEFPGNVIKAVFPTAETVTEELRRPIEAFFKSTVYDQYASSEGAPFIFECMNRKLHIELQSGVFEVLDEDNRPTNTGKLVITSFTTEGTPLIRYDIGDSIELTDEVCNCGNQNPLAKRILGRIDDYVYSPQNGKINLGNVSNTLKGTKGIIKFQVIQDQLNFIIINMIVNKDEYDKKVEDVFMRNWRERVGSDMGIRIVYVDDIPTERSGKFRIVKNNIKHLLN